MYTLLATAGQGAKVCTRQLECLPQYMSQGDTLAETLADKLKFINAHAGQHELYSYVKNVNYCGS